MSFLDLSVVFLPCKCQTHPDSEMVPPWWAKEREQSKRWRRSVRLQTSSACHSSQPCFPHPAAPRGADKVCFINLSLLLPSFWAIKTQFGIVYCGGKIRLNMLREKRSTYWDREGFILVVKGHVSSEASLSQHAIKVVLTACWEEPETG